MSKPQTVQALFIPPPIDGLNRIAAPTQFTPQEARQLDNFYVYDWGIRQCGTAPQFVTYGTAVCGVLFPFTKLVTGVLEKRMLASTFEGGTTAKVYHYRSVTDTSPANVTNTATITGVLTNACLFMNNIFLSNGVDDTCVYSIASALCTTTTFTGPLLKSNYMWTYKGRLYGVYTLDSTIYGYSDLAAITGASNSVDLQSIFYQAGNLSWGASWSYNQGLGNEELCVFGTDSGEVLIYSGDYPAATNWTLIARTVIPPPQGINPVLKIGNELLICTVRGIIPLSQVFGSATSSDTYFLVSRKLGERVAATYSQMCISTSGPFIYLVGGASTDSNGEQIYVLNYERGAWSRLILDTAGTYGAFRAICHYDGYLFIATAAGKMLKLSDYNTTGTVSSASKWRTPFMDFGTNLQKRANMIRTQARNLSNANGVALVASASADLADPASPPTDSRTATAAQNVFATAELAPPAIGRRLSYTHDIASFTGFAEIQGFEVFYEEGGAY